MKQLRVPFTAALNSKTPIQDISEALDREHKYEVDILSWPTYDYKPHVRFSINHGNDCLFLKFYVQESAVRAVYRRTNDPVYKDSCVEFFITFNNDRNYYNFEFNCAGTCHAGYGEDRNDRQLVPEAVISKIRSLSKFKPASATQPDIHWELTLRVPVSVFFKHRLEGLHGLESRVNFFKCGDDLPRPHFLSWNKVIAEEPNFHLPEYFGKIEFV